MCRISGFYYPVSNHSTAQRSAIIGKMTQSLSHGGPDDEGIYLEIADDGKGFDMNIKKRIDSYGIIGMKERAYLLDANLSIESQLGKGTKIHIEMPFSN